MIGLDAYYRDLAHLPLEQRALSNFDTPDSLDDGLLTEHIHRLARGLAAEIPVYDFTQHVRSAAIRRVEPAEFVIVEGLFTLHWAPLRELFDIRVYVTADLDICLARRIDRDVRERGRTHGSVLRQFEATVRPMAEKYVLPTRRFADLELDGTGAIEYSVATVLGAIDRLRRVSSQA